MAALDMSHKILIVLNYGMHSQIPAVSVLISPRASIIVAVYPPSLCAWFLGAGTRIEYHLLGLLGQAYQQWVHVVIHH